MLVVSIDVMLETSGGVGGWVGDKDKMARQEASTHLPSVFTLRIGSLAPASCSGVFGRVRVCFGRVFWAGVFWAGVLALAGCVFALPGGLASCLAPGCLRAVPGYARPG